MQGRSLCIFPEGVPPLQTKRGGTPSPPVPGKTGSYPPSGCTYSTTASRGVSPEKLFHGRSKFGEGGAYPQHEWGVPPTPLQNWRGGYLPALPPLLCKTGYHPPFALRTNPAQRPLLDGSPRTNRCAYCTTSHVQWMSNLLREYIHLY